MTDPQEQAETDLWLLILISIDLGIDTPAKIANTLDGMVVYKDLHGRFLALMLQALWNKRYICKVAGKGHGFFKLELLSKGHDAVKLHREIIAEDLSNGLRT